MRKNDGFTLVELIVVVAIGAIVMAAASTVLLLGMRLNNRTAEVAGEQNKVRAALYVMETTAKQNSLTVDEEHTVKSLDGSTLFYYDEIQDAIFMSGNLLLDGVSDFKAVYAPSTKLLTVTLKTESDNYEMVVYCRSSATVPGTGNSDTDSTEEIPLPTIYNIEGRNRFLSLLAGEVGSKGQSLTTGEYFSEWYIGSYEANPGWGPETPWCACFLSWALDQCGEDLFGTPPRYAHVDKFMAFFPEIRTDLAQAQPGDVIFFDMEQDGKTEPTHVGAVVRVADGYVHTVEGNTDGTVAGRKYALDDGQILGYGVLNWK